MEKYGRAGQATDDTIIRCIRIACWINKATNTHSEYVTLNAFPRLKWLRERAKILYLKNKLPLFFHFIQNQQEKAKEDFALFRSN